MLSCGIKCYHVGLNIIMWGSNVRSNVIMFCYHVMLSCDVIMGHDNTSPILFFLKTSQTRTRRCFSEDLSNEPNFGCVLQMLLLGLNSSK